MKRRRPLKDCRRCAAKVPRLAYGICPACVEKDKAAADKWAALERKIARRLGISMTDLLSVRAVKADRATRAARYASVFSTPAPFGELFGRRR